MPRKSDPRLGELFHHVHQAVNILGDLLTNPATAEPPPRAEAKGHQRELPAPAIPDKLAYSIKEVIKLAEVSRTMLYREISVGRLRAVKRGNRTLILSADLRDWIARWPTSR
jgi:excisionase family DNA binding protein